MTWYAGWSVSKSAKLLPLLLTSCVGEIGSSQGLPPEGPGPGRGDMSGSTPASCDALGATPLARLARQEYLNTVADLFQIQPPAATTLPDDGDFGGFKTTAGQTLNAPLAEKYVDAAAAIASSVLLEQERVFGCAGRDEPTCIAEFLGSMGARLFRRPLRDAETQHYLALFAKTRAAGTFEQAASVTLQALLLAPQFLFHIVERPPAQAEGQAYALNDYQLAARLSYLFWRTTPDAELVGLATQGGLRDPAVLGAQVERLMNDERARPVTRSFLTQWLKLENIERIMVDPIKEPNFTPALLGALAQETRSFVEHTFWSSSDTVRELLISKTRFRNQTLGQFYGDSLGASDALAPVLAEPDQKAFGLLSQAGFLAAISRTQEAAIIYRGRFVREKLMCGQMSLPPPNLVSPLPEFAPGMTSRERIAEHTGGAACVGCHQLMNPIGFALEHFDYLGRWRDMDHGLPIDTSAMVGDDVGQVNDAFELSQRLSESDAVALCGARQTFEFTMGRAPTAEDACQLDSLVAENPRNLRGILQSVPQSRAFQYRVEPKP